MSELLIFLSALIGFSFISGVIFAGRLVRRDDNFYRVPENFNMGTQHEYNPEIIEKNTEV